MNSYEGGGDSRLALLLGERDELLEADALTAGAPATLGELVKQHPYAKRVRQRALGGGDFDLKIG